MNAPPVDVSDKSFIHAPEQNGSVFFRFGCGCGFPATQAGSSGSSPLRGGTGS
jgi:hypothetical protein